MSGRKRYEQAISSLAQRKETKSIVFSGVLGVTTGGENVVDVGGRPGYVWVRLRNQLNELVQAFNENVSPVFDLPVLVEWDKFSPTRYKVISRDVGRYSSWGSVSSYLPAHDHQHSFDPNNIGGDIIWIYTQQFQPFLVTPSGSAGAFSLSIQPHVYYFSDEFHYAGGTGIAGFDNLRPTGSSSARMLLIYLEPENGNILIATGSLTEFDNSITGTAQILQYIPSLIDANDIPLAGLRLITGTNQILWPNIYDIRSYFAAADGTYGGGSAPVGAEYVTMALNGTLTDERVLTAGSDITLADGGAGGNATVGVATGTFSRAGHSHLFPYSVAIYDDHVFQATGTILDFTGNIDVAVTGTSVFISSTAAGGGGATLLIYDDGVFKVTGTAVSFDDNLTVHITGSTAYVVGQAGGAGGFPIIYDDSVFKNTGVAISFDEDIEAVATGTTSYVGIPTGTFSRPGHTHTETNTLLFYEDDVFVATGTAIDFGTNVNVAVTGSVIYVSTVDTTGEGDLLIYDDSVFKATGTAISFDDNLTVHVTGSIVYIDGQAGGGAGGFPAIYDDKVFVATGSAISFDDNFAVVATGTSVFVSNPVVTYQRTAIPTALNGDTGPTWLVPDEVYASGSLAVFLNGVAQIPGTDYEEMFYISGTYRYFEALPTGSYQTVIYGVPCVTQTFAGTGTGDGAFALQDSDSVLLLDSDSVQLLDSDG